MDQSVMKDMKSSVLASLLILCAVWAEADPVSETVRGRILDRHGSVFAETVDGGRRYPQGETAALMIGYLRAGDPEKGTAGLEKSFDESLGAGKDLALTIDLRLQKIAREVFPEDLEGSIVAIEPGSGEIRALASFPGFDLNLFGEGITQENFKRLIDDRRKPLMNRSIHPYPPGSIYQVVTALAAGMEAVYDREFRCEGSVRYGNKSLKCWVINRPQKMHGELDLTGALKQSCNAYFYQFANVIGIGSIEEVADALGLTEPTGCGLPNENTGMLTTPEWVRAQGQEWSETYTAIGAGGQGATLATPLQMASMAATVANGGTVYSPSLVRDELALSRTELTKWGVAQGQIDLVRKAFRRIVNDEDGTGGNARSDHLVVAGKAGSAATARPDIPVHAWFVGFAPCEEPELAVCVFVEDGEGGGNRVAAPIARRFLESALKEDGNRR
jgi:penicillin-binding protein 2